ncbi:hypothetical protein [Roseateles sp.]|uniref:hypothetical protein n=1 Tax=Roseateles sp. TaxID=1971397 RepID=UPI0025F43256|nr:hypothetical protein [Roseateles sp.]MBV8034516.1 hypothetical protein [Roseateles sp.]
MTERLFPDATFPALNPALLDIPTPEPLVVAAPSQHRPRILMLYGSLHGLNISIRDRSLRLGS